MKDEIFEIENIIPKDYQDHLARLMSSFDFPWYYNPSLVSGDSVFQEQENNISGFNHFFYEEGKSTSPFFDLIYPLVLSITSKADARFNILMRMRANLTFPNKSSTLLHHMPHIDSFSPHWNAIYYVNDSDGDTFIFNETNDNYSSGDDDIERIKNSEFTIKHRCTPKKGKILVFTGKYYHSSSFCKESKHRCVINMNLGQLFNG